METKENKHISKFSVVLIGSFIIFISLYITNISDINGYNNYKKMTLTKSSIRRFESDIKEGKDLSLDNYAVVNTKDYSNVVSNTGLELGKSFSKIFEGFISESIKAFMFLFG